MRNTGSTRNAPEKGPKGGAGATPRHLRYGAAGEAGGLPSKGRPNPQDPKGGIGATPRHTAPRRGEGGRRPTRRAAPTPQDPKGGAGATSHHPAPRRDESARRPTRRAAHYCQRSDPAPPEIGRGSKRALTHRAGKSNRLM